MALVSSKASKRGGPIVSGRAQTGKVGAMGGKKVRGHKGHSDHTGAGPIQSGRIAGSVRAHDPLTGGAKRMAGNLKDGRLGAITSMKHKGEPLARAFSAPNTGLPEHKTIGRKGGHAR